MAIPCHDANILLRDGLAPAGGSSAKFIFDFGTGVAEVRRYCAKLETWTLLRLLSRRRAFAADLYARCKRSNNGSNSVARLGNRRTVNERFLVQIFAGLAPGQSTTSCERKFGCALKAGSILVALSKEANRLELYGPTGVLN